MSVYCFDLCGAHTQYWKVLEINTNPFKKFVHLTTNSLTCTTSEIQTKPTKIQNLRFYQAVK